MLGGLTRAAIAATALVWAACGPIEYMSQVTRTASSELEAARAVRADKYAPYWYTLAAEYLHKAREEAAHADYQAANRFGRRASEAARKARQVALEVASDPAATRTLEGDLPPPDPGSAP